MANKQILAQIMKGCVNEYSDCTVDDIVEKYIEGTPEVGSVGVHVDDTNRPNPQYGGLSDLDLLTFTQKKKIAISASFGIEKLPSSCETKVKQCLSTFDAISVREEAAKRIVEENTGRTDVEVLIDPRAMSSLATIFCTSTAAT